MNAHAMACSDCLQNSGQPFSNLLFTLSFSSYIIMVVRLCICSATVDVAIVCFFSATYKVSLSAYNLLSLVYMKPIFN